MDTMNSAATPKFNWEANDLVDERHAFKKHVEFWRKGPMSKNKEDEHCNYLMIRIGERYILNVEPIRGR